MSRIYTDDMKLLLVVLLVLVGGCMTVQRTEPFTQKWARAVENRPPLNWQDRSRSFSHGEEAPPDILDEEAGARAQPPRDRMEVAYRIRWKEGARGEKRGR